jgi:predicted ATPase/DNA-binding SARP family transcriptional activator
VEIRLLGALEVEANGRSAPLGGLRQKAVLAFLAINANQVVPAERIAEEIWAGEPPPGVQTTLQGYVFHLRKALAGTSAAIETRRPGYLLRVDDDEIDVRRCERLISDAADERAHGRAAVAATLLREALDLWRGEPLADFVYETFAQTEIARLTELHLTAIEARIDAELELGHHNQLVAELEALVRSNPLREALRGQLMLALHRSGRSAEALRVYAQGRELLVEELGIDPGPALQRLERSILMQDPEIDTAAPQPAAIEAGNLPAATTSFVGRTHELRAVTSHLSQHRLVTLTGAGGTGKTRLSIECATRLASGYSDGTWIVELAGISDPELVPAALAGALGVADVPDVDLLDGLCRHLAGRSALLVVDNCEHLVDAAAQAVDTLLRSCPRIRILATSREALGVPGELAWPVPTLGVPDPAEPATLADLVDHAAIALFLERAATARPGFEATEANIGTIVNVCRHLDGMPLAIELAAARLRVLTVEQLSERLKDRFALLSTGGRTASNRHRTLRATVDWSYDSLSEPEQALFRRLSVFAGTFTLEKAEAVAPGAPVEPGEILDLLTSLVNKSLVVPVAGPPDGFRLLETLREYGAERLRDQGEAETIRHRHAEVFTAAAAAGTTGMRGPEGRSWLDRLVAEHDDSRAALEWLLSAGEPDAAADLAAALWPFWQYRSAIGEGRSWLQRVLDAGPDPARRLAVLLGVARLASDDRDLATAEAACTDGLELAAELGDDRSRGQLLIDQAEAVFAKGGEYSDAAALAQDAVTILRAEGDPWNEAYAARLLSHLAYVQGDATGATTQAERCLTLLESCGDIAGSAGAGCLLAALTLSRWDLVRATELCQQAIVQFREMRDRWGLAEATNLLGRIALTAGDSDRATQLSGEALRIADELGALTLTVTSLLVLGAAAVVSGDLDRARAVCTELEVLVERRELQLYSTSTTSLRAEIALAEKAHEGALALAQNAFTRARAQGTAVELPVPLIVGGLAKSRLGDLAGAQASLEEGLEAAQTVGHQHRVSRALVGLAEVAALNSEFERAARYLSSARTTRADAGISLAPREQEDHERLVATVRAGLGDTAFARAWAAEWDEVVIDLRGTRRATAGPQAN